MNLIHKITRNLLLANTEPPNQPNLVYDPGHSHTFNPTLIEDITTYQSTVGNIFFYFLVHTALYIDDQISPEHMAIFESVLIYDCASWVAVQLARYANTPGNSGHNLTTLRVLMLTEVDAHVDGLMTRTVSNESFIQATRVVIQHVLRDAFHVTPNSLFVGPDPVEPTESHYRTVSLTRDHAASIVPPNPRPRYTLRNYESNSESSVEDSICFLPYNMSCPTHNISGPRCALLYVNYLHGAVIRHMVPPSDNFPWVPSDESMELQRYNARKRGIAFPTDQAQGDPKRQDSSSSSSTSSHVLFRYQQRSRL